MLEANSFSKIFGPKEKSARFSCVIGGQSVAGWVTKARRDRDGAIDKVRQLRKRALDENCQIFVGEAGNLDLLTPEERDEQRYYPINVIYNISTIDVIEFAKIGTMGVGGKRPDGWIHVKKILYDVMGIAPYSIVFATKSWLEADFLESVSKHKARVLTNKILELNRTALSWLDGDERAYRKLIWKEGTFFLNFHLC